MSKCIYYKAVRLDGTDFCTGTILYETGRIVEPALCDLPPSKRRLCGPGVLHAATVPTETLIGGSWPCRLFEVTGRVTNKSSKHPHKMGFRRLVVGKELPAWQVFGPQGQEVIALIDRAARLTATEARALYAAQNAAWDAAWDATWSAARSAARNAAWDADWSAAWDAAWDVIWDAAIALVVRDLISVEHFNTLAGPWFSVVGAPNEQP